MSVRRVPVLVLAGKDYDIALIVMEEEGVPGTGLSYVSTTSGRTYKSNAYQTHRQLQAQQKQLHKEQEMEPAKYEVDVFENQCEIVQSIHKEEKKLTKTGKLSTKQLTKTRYYEWQQDYVCSCTLRIARDLFALLPLNTVIIHASDTQLNTETGHEERLLVLSIQIDREILTGLNFDHIDCSDSMNNFPHHMNFRKTKGFVEVEKVNVDGS